MTPNILEVNGDVVFRHSIHGDFVYLENLPPQYSKMLIEISLCACVDKVQ